MANFKIALSAGHGINTAGRRCLKKYDPEEHREWWLNDRVCDYVEALLKDYEGVEILRMDDSDDGEENIALAARVAEANTWGADYYLSVHHNAGVNGGKGGGIVVYRDPLATDEVTVGWHEEMYDALIRHTGLKGNRSNPVATAAFYVLRYTKMPATLLELGFMDSSTDIPIIITDEFAQNCAKAIVEVIVKRAGLTKKVVAEDEPTGPVYLMKEEYRKTFSVNAAAGLNMRTGPGTGFSKVKALANGAKLTSYGFYAIDEDGAVWIHGVDSTGKDGFCHAGYLR